MGNIHRLKPAVSSADADAQLKLGLRYYQSGEVTQDSEDYALAAHCFQMAAAQGLAAAQFNLGLMCYHGRGLPLDFVQAAFWYQLAAEQGHTDAQLNLASMYTNGEGVAQYDAESARLCTLAAQKGNPGAQFNVGLMYANGKGVCKDQVTAYMWLSIAISSGFTQAIDKLDHLALNMTDDEIDEAQHRALQWSETRV